MKLSILMAGIESRPRDIEKQVVEQLNRSIPHCDMEETNTDGKILITTPLHYQSIKAEFIRFIDDGTLSSGVKRSTLTSLAKGKYICFIDDDDLLTNDYVDQLLAGCHSNADVITFNLEMFNNGVFRDRWQFGLYPNDRKKGLMCVNHLCAWKKEIATLVNWDPLLGNSDDWLWFQPLYYAGVITSQYHICKTLYKYLFYGDVTSNQRIEKINFAKQYVSRGFRCFRHKETNEILVETNPRFVKPLFTPKPNEVLVRNHKNEYLVIPLNKLIEYHSVKL